MLVAFVGKAVIETVAHSQNQLRGISLPLPFRAFFPHCFFICCNHNNAPSSPLSLTC